MKPNPEFLNLDRSFWAVVQLVGQDLGYTVRGKDKIRVPTIREIAELFRVLQFKSHHLCNQQFQPTELGQTLLDYFE